MVDMRRIDGEPRAVRSADAREIGRRNVGETGRGGHRLAFPVECPR